MAEQQPEVKIKFVKKKGGHAAAHGGAWKVAYADLVTAMMAFFLLMWLLNSSSQNTKAGIAGSFQDPNFFNTEKGKAIMEAYKLEKGGILPGGRGMKEGTGDGGSGPEAVDVEGLSIEAEKKAMEETARTIEKVFQEDKVLQTFQDQIAFEFTDEGLRIQLQDKAAQVLFDSGSATLKAYTLSILKEIAKELGKLPNHILIGGHTDAMQYTNQAYTNWELSADRANSARRVLESAGLRPGQVRRVTGYAATQPLEGKDPKDPMNRRISIVVLSSATEKAEQDRQKVKPKKS
ncbi:MAG TPA: flagellar motor protein MotB [Holophaga sp.]|nr:flagellar motor protein MotB [Holophaga sp.]